MFRALFSVNGHIIQTLPLLPAVSPFRSTTFIFQETWVRTVESLQTSIKNSNGNIYHSSNSLGKPIWCCRSNVLFFTCLQHIHLLWDSIHLYEASIFITHKNSLIKGLPSSKHMCSYLKNNSNRWTAKKKSNKHCI